MLHSQPSTSEILQKTQQEDAKKLVKVLTELRNKVADAELKNILLEKQTQELRIQKEEACRGHETSLRAVDQLIAKTLEDCHKLKTELQNLYNTKQTLGDEILIYRNSFES